MTDQTFDEVSPPTGSPALVADVLSALIPKISEVRWAWERLEAVMGDLDFYIDFDARKATQRALVRGDD